MFKKAKETVPNGSVADLGAESYRFLQEAVTG